MCSDVVWLLKRYYEKAASRRIAFWEMLPYQITGWLEYPVTHRNVVLRGIVYLNSADMPRFFTGM